MVIRQERILSAFQEKLRERYLTRALREFLQIGDKFSKFNFSLCIFIETVMKCISRLLDAV